MRGRVALAQREVVRTAEGVEQVELRGGNGELAVLVLPEEREQPAAQLLQVGRARRAALDERPRAALGADSAAEDDLVRAVGQPIAEVGELVALQQLGTAREEALHVRLGRARPNDPGAWAPAEQQIQGVSEDGLAGPGLAGDCDEARPEPQLGSLDQQKVLDAELEEHAAGLPAGGDGPVERASTS